MTSPATEAPSFWRSSEPTASLDLRLTPIALELLFRDLQACEAGVHPTEEDIVEYLRGGADRAIEAHLKSCEQCLARASSLTDDFAGEHQATPQTEGTAAHARSRAKSSAAVRPRELMLANLQLLNDLVGFVARRYGLASEQADELASFVRLRLLEDDYAVLRRWRSHQSTLKTYLTVVVQQLFREYCRVQWGKWRASAAALRLGPLAEALEELVYRDGLSLAEASRVLASRDGVDADELARLYDRLPPSLGRPRAAGVSGESAQPSIGASQDAILQRAREESLARTVSASLRRLPARDRVLLRLRFGDGCSLAQIARALCSPPKALHKRLDGVLKAIRQELREGGIECDVEDLLRSGPYLDNLQADAWSDEAVAAGLIGRR